MIRFLLGLMFWVFVLGVIITTIAVFNQSGLNIGLILSNF